jgi:hypothetical protein
VVAVTAAVVVVMVASAAKVGVLTYASAFRESLEEVVVCCPLTFF